MRPRFPSALIALLLSAAFVLSPPATAQVVRQVTDAKTGLAGPGAMDDAGSLVVAGSSTNQDGANPRHAFRVVRFDPATGALTPLISDRDGVAGLVSVSDDGQWMAFASPADLTGANPDRSSELFVARTDGSAISQLSDDPRPNAGSVTSVALSGDGARIAFIANTDPLGTNPEGNAELFVIERDGSGLAQLTSQPAGSVGGPSISDDGARIAFSSSSDLVSGSNPDGSSEVFAILADGGDLRQLTSSAEGASFAALSGDGGTVAFQSSSNPTGGNPENQSEIFAIDWAGTNLRQLTSTTALLDFGDPSALAPSISDDGNTVVFFSNHYRFPFTNIDSNFEIWKVDGQGGGLTALTATAFSAGCLLPTVSGDGSRITFYTLANFSGGSNPDGNPELWAMRGDGGGKTQLTNTTYTFRSSAVLSPAGTLVVFVDDEDPLFEGGQLYRVKVDGSELAQITNIADDPENPSIAGDDQTIVFASAGEIYRVFADGSGLLQLSGGAGGASDPDIAKDASLVFFTSTADPIGTNADGSREVFRVAPGGGGLAQVTSAPTGNSALVETDADGSHVVFESRADLDGTNPDGSIEVFRASADGTSVVALTSDPLRDARRPHVDESGNLVVWDSDADPLGTNPELNREVFLRDVAAGTTRQLTSFAEGSSFGARLSGDGRYVYFSSDAPVFETDPDRPTDFYRLELASDALERVSGLRNAGLTSSLGAFGGIAAGFGGGASLSVDTSGERAAFAAGGDPVRENPDALPEVFVIDRLAEVSIEVSKETPTLVSFPVLSGPLRYDVLRGQLGELSRGGGATTDLGATLCLEDDSPDNDTRGFEDTEEPQTGRGFFYLFRGSQGLDLGPGSYGTNSEGGERQPASGGCS